MFFDIDGTLMDHDGASEGSLRRLLTLETAAGRLEDEHFAEALREWRRLELLHYDEYLSGAIDLIEQRRRRAAGILEWIGSGRREPAELERWFEDFLATYEDGWAAFDDVADLVAALEAMGHLRLGVITNADESIQRRKLAAIGVGERLPAFVASSTIGAAKPDPAIFAAACELVGLRPDRVAYVGDRLDVDALGARDAGMAGVWLKRPGAAATGPAAGEGGRPPEGIHVIESLGELVAVLGLDRA